MLRRADPGDTHPDFELIGDRLYPGIIFEPNNATLSDKIQLTELRWNERQAVP